MKTLIVGASTNIERYSFKAAKMLLANGHEIELLGRNKGEIAGKSIETKTISFIDIDTITLYLAPYNQPLMYDYLLGLKPRRIIFNPGTENPEFEEKARNAGVIVEEACTLVLLSTKQY